MSKTNSQVIDVAVGVVTRPDGQVLLGQRPAGKPYAGWWEFPGGKLEPGESVHEALSRELAEELGLQVHDSSPWLVREYTYEHAHVRLHFRRVTDFDGEPQSREGQAFIWSHPGCADVEPLLPATVPLMRLLALPSLYGISAAALLGINSFLDQLDVALVGGVRLLQLREPELPNGKFDALFEQTLQICQEHDCILLVNSCHPAHYWERADGVHLRSRDFGALPKHAGGEIRRLRWIAASCHSRAELTMAADAGADFATLSPIRPTDSHPDTQAMGWQQFSATVLASPLPVFALGGLTAQDLSTARAAGAHGIAMIRGIFHQ